MRLEILKSDTKTINLHPINILLARINELEDV